MYWHRILRRNKTFVLWILLWFISVFSQASEDIEIDDECLISNTVQESINQRSIETFTSELLNKRHRDKSFDNILTSIEEDRGEGLPYKEVPAPTNLLRYSSKKQCLATIEHK